MSGLRVGGMLWASVHCAVLVTGCRGGAVEDRHGGQAGSAGSQDVQFEEERAEASAPPASELVTRGESELVSGDATAAEATFREALAENESDVRAWLGLGLSLEMLERADDAARAYRSALEVDPQFAEALNNLGVILRDRGDLDEAIAILQRAVEARPGFASAYLNLALCLEEAQRPAEAIRAYQRVIELAPQEPLSRVQLGLLQLSTGEREQARITLRRAVAPAGQSRALLAALGNGLRRAGDPQMAIRVLRRAIDVSEEPAPPSVRAELALALFAADHRPDAERTLVALISDHADYAIAHFLLANMYASRGQSAQARVHYRQYLRLDPQGPQAERARTRMNRLRE